MVDSSILYYKFNNDMLYYIKYNIAILDSTISVIMTVLYYSDSIVLYV